MVDQHQNFQDAILRKKARIEEINLILAQPRQRGQTSGSIRKLIEERLHLEQAVAELEREDHRLQFQSEVRTENTEGFVDVASSAGIWRSFRSDFKALADEELTLDPGNQLIAGCAPMWTTSTRSPIVEIGISVVGRRKTFGPVLKHWQRALVLRWDRRETRIRWISGCIVFSSTC